LYEKWAAERAALRFVGVTAVASEIIVDLPFESERTDEDIAAAAASHLNWNSQAPDTIKLKVSHGWITLQGTAEWQYQKEEAARSVRSLHGVKAVMNEIELKPTVNSMDIQVKIEAALKRDAQIEAKDIVVETSGALVTLRGRVPIFVAQTLGSQSNSCSTLFLIVSAVFTRTPFLLGLGYRLFVVIPRRDRDWIIAGSRSFELCRIALRNVASFLRMCMKADNLPAATIWPTLSTAPINSTGAFFVQSPNAMIKPEQYFSSTCERLLG
jgi:osmotically-inducible protein OsmY